jgi:hypothetical protein
MPLAEHAEPFDGIVQRVRNEPVAARRPVLNVVADAGHCQSHETVWTDRVFADCFAGGVHFLSAARAIEAKPVVFLMREGSFHLQQVAGDV